MPEAEILATEKAVVERATGEVRALAQITICLRLLTTLALLYTAYFAAGVLVPFVISVMLSLALAPLVRALVRVHIPSWAGAVIVLLSGVSIVVSAVFALSTPAAQWVADAPAKLRELEPALLAFKEPLQSVKDAGKGVGDIALMEKSADDVTVVKMVSPSAFDVAVSATPSAMAELAAIVFFLYFLLASGPQVTSKLSRLLEYRVSQRRIISLAQQVQREMSHYLLTVSVINFSLGSITAFMLWVFKIPDPLLWGALVAILNFAPYIGALTSTVILTLVALIEFGSIPEAVTVAAAFFTITVLEGQLFAPVILGRRLALSPYVVFVAIIFWGWLWGIPGALMAVPLMVCVKIVCEQIPEMKWLAILVQREKPLKGKKASPVADESR